MLDESTSSFSCASDPRPGPLALAPYEPKKVDAEPWIRLGNHGSADIPRNRFDYAVELRQHQQYKEWTTSQIKQSMLGDAESQYKVARRWVIDQWQRWGIWNREWPEDGPGSGERWGNGLPACLLAMELTWEIEHILTIQQPVDVSRICDTKAPQNPDTPPLNWSWQFVAALAANQLFERHSKDGFPATKIELPSVVFRQDLKALSVNLPEPVQKLMATVENWDDLALPSELQPEGQNIFGDPISRAHREARTLQAGGARNSGHEERRGLFGTAHRQVIELQDGDARESYNEEGRDLSVTKYRESSPSKNGIFLTDSGRVFFGISGQEADDDEIESAIGNLEWVANGRTLADLENADNWVPNRRPLADLGNADDEEAVRTSGRQIEEEQKAEIAEIAASIRAIRGPRRRDLHRKPGEKTVRLTQGGRIKKAYK
ncbi:hypothetical protein MY5147_003297 [Beauveria neobassiana]|uniref:Uncharacterized protein n=1 Tax=Beauveria bassiana TaxID=176275 RepID=A0A2S7XX68_BEABA|nr:hypothetical protein BB8028_0001g03310 [Beauveria bassiana]